MLHSEYEVTDKIWHFLHFAGLNSYFPAVHECVYVFVFPLFLNIPVKSVHILRKTLMHCQCRVPQQPFPGLSGGVVCLILRPFIWVLWVSWAAFQKCCIICWIHTETGRDHSGSTLPEPERLATDVSHPNSSSVIQFMLLALTRCWWSFRSFVTWVRRERRAGVWYCKPRCPSPTWSMLKAWESQRGSFFASS